jgi:hypothetical protein
MTRVKTKVSRRLWIDTLIFFFFSSMLKASNHQSKKCKAYSLEKTYSRLDRGWRRSTGLPPGYWSVRPPA